LIKELENFIEENTETTEKLAPLSWYGGVYRYLLDTKKVSNQQLHVIAKKIKYYQRSDGGFQIETRGTLGSVVETAVALDFLLDLGKPPSSNVITRAVKFLITQQREDGGFAENINVRHPIEWDDKYIYEKRISTPHITAWVLRALLKAGLSKENSAVSKALNYLAVSQKTDGGWSHFKSEIKSSLHLTALISIALGEFREFRHAINFESLKNYLFNYQKENGSVGDCLDASLLVAEAWHNLGIGKEHPDMHRLLEWITKQQDSDGSFMDRDCGWPDTVENRVTCSMNTMRVLYKTGYSGETT
jgi:prenyltransferase beta subunit